MQLMVKLGARTGINGSRKCQELTYSLQKILVGLIESVPGVEPSNSQLKKPFLNKKERTDSSALKYKHRHICDMTVRLRPGGIGIHNQQVRRFYGDPSLFPDRSLNQGNA